MPENSQTQTPVNEEKNGLLRVFYLFLRMSPFIIVCYFILLSIFNKDIKGVIYLAGLMFAAIIVKQAADLSLFGADNKDLSKTNIKMCNLTSLGTNEQLFSKAPLGVMVLFFTFAYLLTAMISYSTTEINLLSDNLLTILLFLVLIIAECRFQSNYNCFGTRYISYTGLISTILGIMWAMVVENNGFGALQYFNGASSAQTCKTSKKIYTCKKVTNV